MTKMGGLNETFASQGEIGSDGFLWYDTHNFYKSGRYGKLWI